jgi:glucosamine--fructose-6-phosphate aminotransferase (isomerizing)
MCGIMGYIGSDEAWNVVVGGLRRLEYRGYDSAGVVTVSEGSRESITTGELMARYELIRNRHRWGLTRPEIREVVQEIRILRRTGRY